VSFWIENTWVFPALEALHVVALALMVGTILLGDLRVLGLARATAPEWLTRTGWWLIVVTGLPMFYSGLARYRENPAFLVKMIALAIALATHHTIHKRGTRATAVLSIAVWTFTILAARAVIDFDA
jgi:hypothetical protein